MQTNNNAINHSARIMPETVLYVSTEYIGYAETAAIRNILINDTAIIDGQCPISENICLRYNGFEFDNCIMHFINPTLNGDTVNVRKTFSKSIQYICFEYAEIFAKSANEIDCDFIFVILENSNIIKLYKK